MHEQKISELWHHLHWLSVLAQQGSYTAAAARLGVSKAAMSQRIAELERAARVPLVLRTRPERIEAGWFDGQPVCRDYHVAEGLDHRLCWAFRERRSPNQGWFLHGWFN